MRPTYPSATPSTSNLREVTFREIQQARGFLTEFLENPLLLVAASVSAGKDGLVHLVFDATTFDRELLDVYDTFPVEAPYTKPGYTPITVMAGDASSKLMLVATTRDALENPNFKGFASMMRSFTYGKGFTIGETDQTVNVLIGDDFHRLLLGSVNGGEWKTILGLPEGRIDLLIANGVVGFVRTRTRGIIATTFGEIAAFLREQKTAPNFRPVGQLQRDLVFVGRMSPAGILPINLQGPHGVDYHAGMFKVDGTKIQFQLLGESIQSTSGSANRGFLVGSTVAGIDQQNAETVAFLNVDGTNPANPKKFLDFVPPDTLSPELQRFVGRIATGEFQPGAK